MGVALKDLRGKVKRPVRAVSICLDGELWAEHDRLSAKLEQARQGPAKNTMTGGATVEQRQISEEILALEARMREAEVVIEVQGISMYRLKEIQRRFPNTDTRYEWDPDEGAHALIAACAVEPTTEDEARELLEEMHQAAARKLFNAAWEASTASDAVPFNVRASATTAASGSK